MFIYLGRRGFSRFVLQVARAATTNYKNCATIVVSQQNDSYELFKEFGSAIASVDTFSKDFGAVSNVWRIPVIRSRLKAEIDRTRPDAVIELMPHVWSSFIFSGNLLKGISYIPIIHDYRPHPGDYRSSSIVWLLKRVLRRADVIFTLSGAVAGRLEADSAVDAKKIVTLFHPDLDFGGYRKMHSPPPGGPIRLLFFGRIMHYKGLSVFLDMIDELRARKIAAEVAVIGEGDLGPNLPRLRAMGAEVINRWLTEAEIGHHLPRFHAMVLSHVEASQSGVAAAALGAGIPVIATPVGGIIEQITHGETGLIAKRADAVALADAAETMFTSPGLYAHICNRIEELRDERSMDRFVRCCMDLAPR